MTVRLQNILQKHHDAIVHEWNVRLRGDVSRYSSRPFEELHWTLSELAYGNFDAITRNDLQRLNAIIEHIGTIREKAGFTLPEVQNALELYRTILIPILEREVRGKAAFRELVERMNYYLAYAINRLSEYFQEIHEKGIKDYARTLEAMVEMRTRELAESERKYRQLVEEIRDGYFVSQNGKIAFANQAFCDMHGYALDEVIGTDYKDFVAPDSLNEVMGLYQDPMEDGREEQYVYLRVRKDGSRLPTENKVTYTQYQGEAAGIGICRDITERMRDREAERMAHIGQLTASLAHEIRNPLSSAKMSIKDLLRNLSVSGNDKRRLEILANEVARVDRLVTEMLDFAKPIRFEFKPTEIWPLIDSCLEALDAKIREKKVNIRKSRVRGIPRIPLDREKMEQVILNVLLNSIEAVPEGGRITISVTNAKVNMRVKISDNGTGINSEDLPYIFDPFFSTKRKGIGLGLANAKKVVEAHGGSVDAWPLVSGGTRVTIALPFKVPPSRPLDIILWHHFGNPKPSFEH
ncbi:MAG TPA: ATP-binding protein [Desulfomonilaceae bacterium]|nr:ATP-binding protein [Desulfomonilaceae bacterium]